MTDLLNELPANTYKSLLNIGTENNQTVDETLRNVEDGRGNTSALSLSTTTVKVINLEVTGDIIGPDAGGFTDGGTYNVSS